jgi:hypothetical protein
VMVDRPRGGRQLADLVDLEDGTLAGRGVHESLSFRVSDGVGRKPGRGTLRDENTGLPTECEASRSDAWV